MSDILSMTNYPITLYLIETLHLDPINTCQLKKLEENSMEPGENNALVVDFMSLMHGIHQGQLSTFQDLLNAAWKHIQGI